MNISNSVERITMKTKIFPKKSSSSSSRSKDKKENSLGAVGRAFANFYLFYIWKMENDNESCFEYLHMKRWSKWRKKCNSVRCKILCHRFSDLEGVQREAHPTAAINNTASIPTSVRFQQTRRRFAQIKYFIKYWNFYPPINYDALTFAFKRLSASFNFMRLIEFLIQFVSITVSMQIAEHRNSLFTQHLTLLIFVKIIVIRLWQQLGDISMNYLCLACTPPLLLLFLFFFGCNQNTRPHELHIADNEHIFNPRHQPPTQYKAHKQHNKRINERLMTKAKMLLCCEFIRKMVVAVRMERLWWSNYSHD